MIVGECNCGQVSFEISENVSDVYMCHCSICRRATGGTGIAVTIVKNESFTWTQGEEFVNHWLKPNHDWETSFCNTCGSTLPGKNDDLNIYVPVSLLNSGTEDLKIMHHLHVGSKASWEEIGDVGIKHEQGFKSKDEN